ncbi:unnamed protein product [Gongylonema pulchrum]|uniref:Uncharacterized protein n=1 Tax=Gongylonema pulchrum TaxID=637853 RepID=A0A183DR38_9BILA|nr:unnamed protein product [Gongylonema pulchrum]
MGPLLCAVAYRPCANRSFFEYSMKEPGSAELWQVFRKEMCYRAMNNCGFLLEYKLWPDFIDCSDTAERNRGRRIFSDGSCKMPYDKEPARMKREHCLWPMVDGQENSRNISHPLIDDCYLPCRSFNCFHSKSLKVKVDFR